MPTYDVAGGSGGLLGNGWLGRNPWAIPAGVMAVGALSPPGSGNVPQQINQPPPSLPPMVQGPVARNATLPSGYNSGMGEVNYFPTVGGAQQVDPGATAAMAAPAYAQQAAALSALRSPQQSLAMSAAGIGGSGSPQQQAMMILQAQQQAAANQYGNLNPGLGYARGGALQPRINPDFGGSPYPMKNYDTGTAMPDFGGYMGGGHPSGIKSLKPRRFDDGGPARGNDVANNLIAEAKAAIMGQSDNPDEALQRFVQAFGPDALKQLSAQVTGASGPVHGAGDGVDDLVPGTIDGSEPVRLANDEHVVPADVVSGLGNGSSAQGHRLLKEMTHRVRTGRGGNGRMPPRVKASDLLPG
jgi:hypothetical protein